MKCIGRALTSQAHRRITCSHLGSKRLVLKIPTASPVAMDVPIVSVRVAQLMQPFVLKDVSIGISGEAVDIDTWLQELNTMAPYSEEAFSWKIAALIPCPRSFFTLLYESNGSLRIIIGARKESMDAWDSNEEGYCEGCYARLTPEHQRILHIGESGTRDSVSWDSIGTWNGDNVFCMLCFDSEAYIHLDARLWMRGFDREVRPQNLNNFDHQYLDRLDELYKQLECPLMRV